MDKVKNNAGYFVSTHNELVIRFTKYLVVNVFTITNQSVYVNEYGDAFSALLAVNNAHINRKDVTLSCELNKPDYDTYHIYRVNGFETLSTSHHERINYDTLYNDACEQFSLLTDAFKQHKRDAGLHESETKREQCKNISADNPVDGPSLSDLLDKAADDAVNDWKNNIG